MDRSSLALLISLVVHALVAWWLWQTRDEVGRPPPPAPTEVQFVEPPAKKAPMRYIDPHPDKNPENVVKEELHDASALVSDLNRRYKEQTISRRLGPESNAKTKGKAIERPIDNTPAGSNDKKPADRGDGELVLPRFGASRPKQPLFAPASTGMKVPWVQFGDLTVLNSDRNVYYVFYERMGEQVGNRWVALMDEFVRRQSREELARISRRDREWHLEIILDANGDFKTYHVEQASGFTDLDYTAVEAFKMATPFVNPPRGILGPDGLIHLHMSFLVIMRPPGL